jgi:hypothetical protein
LKREHKEPNILVAGKRTANLKINREKKDILTPVSKNGTNLINLIKFADYVESNIRKFILQQRKKNRKKLFNGSILPKIRN